MEAARPKRKPQRRASRRQSAPSGSAEAASEPIAAPATPARSDGRANDRDSDEDDDDDAQLLAVDAQLLAAMEADLGGGVSDREIAQHEDELFSLLGAAPLTSDAPYASPANSAAGSDGAERALHAPSAPAFDDDDDDEQDHDAVALTADDASRLQTTTDAAAVPATAAVAPSAPCLSESEDEGSPTPARAVELATETRTLAKRRDGLVATGAPEGFPDSSPSGPRTSATPSAPPAMDLDAPASGFLDATGFSGVQLVSSRASDTAPSAPPASEADDSLPPDSAASSHSFAPSAPTESETTSTPPAASTETSDGVAATTTAATPSLSPTATKTISRSKVLDTGAPVAVRGTDDAAAALSAGSVGRAVRDSFAKARMLEASRNLYPSVPQSALADGSASFSHAAADSHAGIASSSPFATALAPKRIHIKLEPFVNFEITLMRAEAAQKRQELKMKRIEANKGELFSRLERYLFSEYLLHTAASTLEASKAEIDSLMKKVWTIETKRLSSSQRCGDHVELEQRMEFQTAKLEPLQLQRLKAHLDKLRQLRTVQSAMHTFDRATAYFHVEQYLNGLLHEPHLVAFLNKMSASCASSGAGLLGPPAAVADLDLVPEGINFFETLPAGSTLASTVDHLKYCIDVLMYFEKKVTVDEKGAFGRVPHSFYRGELLWHSPSGKTAHSNGGGGGMVRKIKCYACGCLNAPMEPTQSCKLCETCDVVLYLPPSSVSTHSNEWYSSVVRFRESLQTWISACLQSLLRTKLLSNMPYLLMHVMYLPRIGTDERSWLLRYLQFPRAMVATNGSLRHAWSEDLVDHYLAMLHLVFHPEKLRRMSVLVSSGPPVSDRAPTAMNGASENVVAVSPEWVLLENPEFLDRCFLSDDDFVAVLNQFPNTFAFEQLFQCTLDTKKSFSRALTLVLELTQSLRAFHEFEKFPVRIAQLLGELLANASQISASTSAASRTSDEVYFYPTLFDQLFLTALHGLLVADCNRVAWKSLREFPFGSLSERAKWDVLALLLFNVHSVPPEAKSVVGWMTFVQRATSGAGEDGAPQKLARETLCDLIASDTENAVFLLHAVAHLAASCSPASPHANNNERDDDERSELVSVAVHELFLAGFTVPACQKALGANGERAAAPISTICLGHPWVISLLLSLLFKYHECAATWIHVFETFPVNRWAPTPADLLSIQEWLLLENTSAPRSALARFLLDHINWEFDVHRDRLFTSPYLHRRVALIVAEAYVLYKTRRERATDPAAAVVVSGGGAPQKLEVAAITKSIRRALWLDDTFDFAHWCWKLVLKLKFYSPRTHAPFLALIDLARDRSREALTLRRWFANAARPGSASSKKVPFYASRERELAQLVARADTAQLAHDGAASYAGASGSGAPIQEDDTAAEQHMASGRAAVATPTAITATAALTTEPIVAYLICQLTTFVFSDRIDRWEPLLQLLKKDLFHASIRVLENVFPVLATFDAMKRDRSAAGTTLSPEPDSESSSSSSDDASGASDRVVATAASGGGGDDNDVEIDVCMAAIESLSTSEMLQLVGVLFDNSYINGDERRRIEDVLQQGYIGGWESTAKAKVLTKLRFVRECSRYLHPALLPALINESFPRSSTTALTTTAILNGAMSWISSTLRGRARAADALSPSTAATATAALAMRRSSIAGSASSAAAGSSGSLGMLAAASEYTASTRALSSLIEREFEAAGGSDAAAVRTVMLFWMRVLLQVPYWFENHEFRHLVDVLMRSSMASAAVGRTAGARALLLELVAELQRAFEALCYQLKASHDAPSGQSEASDAALVVSFLPPADATPLSALFGGTFDAAQHVGGCSFLALWVLLIETRQELPLFLAMGTLMLKAEPKTSVKVAKWKKTAGKLAAELALVGLDTAPSGAASAPVFSKSFLYGHTGFDSLSQYKFYRWCEYCLEVPEPDEAQVLFWQVLFALYFACAGGARIFGHYFLDRDASRNARRVHMRANLQAKLRRMTNYCSTQAQVVLTTTTTTTTTTTSGGSSGGGVAAAASPEAKEQRYAHFVTLAQVYTAMDAWLEERDPNRWIKEDEFVTLPRHYEVKRLREVLQLSDALLAADSEGFDWAELPLWTHLCGFEFSFRPSPAAGDTRAASGAMTADPLNSSHTRSANAVGFVRKSSDLQDEEDFAFVEDASDLRRRHSSFGSNFGGAAMRAVRPLPLLAEHCGPSVLTSLPLVSLSVSEDSCVVTPSIQLNQHGLKSVAVKFSENLSVLVALDAELMDHVAQLYTSKTRTVTQSMPCLEGSNCRQAASFRFEFVEWAVDAALLDAAHTILAQSERCDMQALLTNMTWTMMDHHHASEAAVGPRRHAADQFLKLDGDGVMLVMQILLIDEIVRTLDVELQTARREEQAAASARDTAAADSDDATTADGDSATEATERRVVPPAKQWDKVLDRLHEKGLEWFRRLTELDTKLSRMVPPLREVLWRAIKQLGASFVCVDERETYTLLQLMLEDPTRINLLSDCFYPAGAPSRFVEMFSKLMSASGSAKLSTDEKLVLLRRFDFREWLQPSSTATVSATATAKRAPAPAPSKFDRETVLVIVLADISALFPADRSLSVRATAAASGADKAAAASDQQQLDELLRFYAEIVNLICAAFLDDHAEKVLHALVGVHDDYRFHNAHVAPEAVTSSSSSVAGSSGSESVSLAALPRPVDAKVWEALVSIPLDAWQRLPPSQVEAFVAFFSHHMTTLRWQTALTSASPSPSLSSTSTTSAAAATGSGDTAQYPIAYWQKIGVLKYFLDLFTILCRVSPEPQQWQLITTFFEPLLSTLYQPANTSESSSIGSPWPEHESFSTGTAVCSCFVAACAEFLRKKKSVDSGSSLPTALSASESNAKLTQIWAFYVTVLVPHAPVHICKHLHQFLTRIAWEHWCLTLEIVQQMRELVQSEKQQLAAPTASSSLSSYPFVSWMVRDILCRMTWKATDEWLGTQSDAICSLFLLEFAKLCVELVLDLPHFNPQRAAGSQRPRVLPSSNNVLPPYFVNFVKQQSAFWAKWKLTTSDLDALLQFALAAVTEPLYADRASSASSSSSSSSSSSGYRMDAGGSAATRATALFPANATPALMQDGFTRLQLVLRLLSQVTTLHHAAMTKADAFSRVDRYIRMLYAIFEIDARSNRGNAGAFAFARASDPSAWLVVLQSASCTVLYEKLDEIVQLYRADGTATDGGEAVVAEDVLTSTLVGVLRLCNLPLVESFFKDEQSRRHAAGKGSPSASVSLSWAKCGNVIFVEIDSLVRDFASAHKTTLSAGDSKAKKPGRGGSDDEDSSSSKRRGSGDSSTGRTRVAPTDAIGSRLGRLLWSFLAFRGGELCCLAACGRAVASVHVMSLVAEKSIEKWIIEDRRGAWGALVARLKVPELSEAEFEGACLAQGNLMTLQVLFMQQLRKAPVLTEAFAVGMLGKLHGWMGQLQVASKHALTEMKVLFFAAEVTNFVCKTLADTLPAHLRKQTLRQVGEHLLTLGHARKQHGIMKAIGIGGSLQFNAEFHVACLTVGVFLRLQTRNSVPLREDERIALKPTRTTEKHVRGLEDLLKSKDCFQIGKRMDWMLEFVKSPKHSLADQDEFFVSLFSRMYPSHPWLLAKCTYD
ncbi:hypothetical protein PybrP1_005274 [[Pythium] brassicae (nom. inval.)]|nr:hypothetical protein PybrP1_005274 [[Pythium] brassicae (nom. inval.)]